MSRKFLIYDRTTLKCVGTCYRVSLEEAERYAEECLGFEKGEYRICAAIKPS